MQTCRRSCDMILDRRKVYVFFFNDTATTEIYTLSLHDALPILWFRRSGDLSGRTVAAPPWRARFSLWTERRADRKSTRLNSSHANISYAVFCLKKKKKSAITRLYSSPPDLAHTLFLFEDLCIPP